MTAGREEPAAPSLHPRGEGDLPPSREQPPLPRRSQQQHLDPQLRVPGGRGDGTPFSAFAAPEMSTEPARDVPTGPRAAEFRDGIARVRAPVTEDPATDEG
jgi:hypothetical protein